MNNKKSCWAIFFLVSFVGIWGCAYYNTLFNAKKTYQSGIEIIQKEPDKDTHPQANRYFEQTIEKSWKLIEIYSDKSKYADDALLYIVKSEYNLQKFAQARLHAEQFLSKYPKSDLTPEANLWLGKILLEEAKVDEGKDYLFKSVNTAKKSQIRAEAYYELGYLSFENKNYPEAAEFFEKALKEKSDKEYSAFIQFYLGESYFAQGEYKEAINRYRKVEKFSPTIDIEYKTKFNLARSYNKINKYDNALEILRKMLTAVRFKNFVPFIKTEIADIYYQQNKMDDALDLFKEVVREKASSEGTAQASLNLAKIYENRLQNLDSAVYYYGMVKKLYPKSDSIQTAEQKNIYLSGLKKIKDSIKNDSRLVFRLENDRYFRDSLYNAQLEDSIQLELKKMRGTPDSSQQKALDSLKRVLSGINPELQDTTQENSTAKDSTLEQDKEKDNIETGLSNRKNLFNEPEVKKTNDQKKPDEKDEKEVQKPKELEKRKLPQIKEDLKNNQYHLAEYYLLQIQNYDSSLYYYHKFLDEYQDSVLTPKALYSMYFIYSKPEYLDSSKVDSLENILMSQYPGSSFSTEILTREGKLNLSDSTSKDSLEELGHKMFLRAEKLYYENNVDSALSLYGKVASLDTNLIWSAKAQLNRAWIYEHDLKDKEKAVKEYRHLKDKFPQPKFSRLASIKTAPPPKETESTSAGVGSADTSAVQLAVNRESVQGADSSQVTGGISSPEDDSGSLPAITKTRRYRDWRRNRNK